MDPTAITISEMDEQGGRKLIDPRHLKTLPGERTYWIHIEQNNDETKDWLISLTGIDPEIVDALLADETRPRFFTKGQGLLVVLRGVNLNPGAELDDMISVRVWITPHQIITVNLRRMMAIRDIEVKLDEQQGPSRSGEFLTELADRISDRISPVLEALNDSVDELEERVIGSGAHPQPFEISELRLRIIRLKRHLFPQKEMMTHLIGIKSEWFRSQDRQKFREITDCIIRFAEDLESCRERCIIARDELESQHSQKTNKILYLLSMITVIFLPLGLVTGLLGINVGGIPGANNPLAFLGVCLILVIIVILQICILKLKHWL